MGTGVQINLKHMDTFSSYDVDIQNSSILIFDG